MKKLILYLVLLAAITSACSKHDGDRGQTIDPNGGRTKAATIPVNDKPQ